MARRAAEPTLELPAMVRARELAEAALRDAGVDPLLVVVHAAVIDPRDQPSVVYALVDHPDAPLIDRLPARRLAWSLRQTAFALARHASR